MRDGGTGRDRGPWNVGVSYSALALWGTAGIGLHLPDVMVLVGGRSPWLAWLQGPGAGTPSGQSGIENDRRELQPFPNENPMGDAFSLESLPYPKFVVSDKVCDRKFRTLGERPVSRPGRGRGPHRYPEAGPEAGGPGWFRLLHNVV